MTKIGVFINSPISDSEFESIIEPYLKDEHKKIFSNFRHDKIIYVPITKNEKSDSNLLCRKRINQLSKEFYSRFSNTPLCNEQFNFWTHLRFNSYLQILPYYEIKAWIDHIISLTDEIDFVFQGVSSNTYRLIKHDYKRVSFVTKVSRAEKPVKKTKLILNLLKVLYKGGIGIGVFFRYPKQNLLVSIRGSINKVYCKNGLVVDDKFMHYISSQIHVDNYECLFNSNLYSVKELIRYSNNSVQKKFDVTGETILFHALFKYRFYKEIFKASKFLKNMELKQNSLLDVILKNNQLGVYTELFTYWSYFLFFKKRKYKNIILVSEMSPATNSIVRVAKQFGINTIGIQHGLLNENNFAYNYTDKELEMDNPFPDKLVVWGNEEAKFLSKNKSILKDTVQVLGNVVLDGLKHLPKRKEDETFTVFFATQPQPIQSNRMKSMIDFVEAILKFNPKDIKVIIRLHPREVTNYELYKEQIERLKGYNLQIDKGLELFSQLNIADVVVTSYSTVSKDAMILRKPIILQDYSGSDLTGLLKRDVALNALNENQLFQELNAIKRGERKISAEKYQTALSEIYSTLDFNVAERIVELLK